MSNLHPPSPKLIAELEKHALACIAGMQQLAFFTRADSAEYKEVWAKTVAAKEAYEALMAEILGPSS